MPTCTEVALLRLKPARTQQDLASDAAHGQALEILARQPGFLSCTWGVLMEDSSMLVWLVGRSLHLLSLACKRLRA
jgi:hypothetical protein